MLDQTVAPSPPAGVRQFAPIESDQIFTAAFDYAEIGMGLLSRDGKCIRANQALARIFGYRPDQLPEFGPNGIDSSHKFPSWNFDLSAVVDGTLSHTATERPYIHPDGRAMWISFHLSLIPGQGSGEPLLLLQAQDITERKASERRSALATEELEAQKSQLVRANRQLLELARIDPLTGIFNRRVLDERLIGWVTVAHRFRRPLSFVMIDVDIFKRYNDRFGHADGDEALRRIAKQIQLCCRESDVAARYGGEEFAIVCPETARFGALELAERVRRSIRELPMRHDRLTVSVGTASLRPGGDHDSLVRDADSALYRAKELGRDRSCCFE